MNYRTRESRNYMTSLHLHTNMERNNLLNETATSESLRLAAAQALERSHNGSNSTRIIINRIHQRPPTVHPHFRNKRVHKVFCKNCNADLCERGMRAILLGNTNVELFSTDRPPSGVELVEKDYFAKNCRCRIRDAACLGCGSVCSYHVVHPCEKCLESCNNGHFWSKN
jgi:hypothetical protein